MNNKLNQFLLSFVLVLVASFCSFVIAFAGNLTPPAGSPSPTMFSLEQIYNSLAGTSYDSSGFSPNADGNIQEQLKYIASVLPDYPYGDENPEYVAGTAAGAGALLANLNDGLNTAETFEVDDYNNGGAPATGRYETNWTACSSGNGWCGLGVNGEDVASKMDNITGLVWSYPCSGVNCVNMSNETSASYNHANAITNCSSGAHGKSGWRLPTHKELMVAYVNGSYGNLEPVGANIIYWSATSASSGATSVAWRIGLASGSSAGSNKTNLFFVRCVQLAP